MLKSNWSKIQRYFAKNDDFVRSKSMVLNYKKNDKSSSPEIEEP